MNINYDVSDNKEKLKKYLEFKNNIEYGSDYISKLIYEQYIRITPYLDKEYLDVLPYSSKEHTNYSTSLLNIYNTNIIYKEYEEIIKEIISYYDIHNIEFSNYLRSLNCILNTLKMYYELEEDNTFNNYDIELFKKLLTKDLQKLYQQINGDNEQIRLNTLINNISTIKEYSYIYEQVCYSSNWNFLDLNKIIKYIYKYNLDIYNILQILAADYNHAMYKIKPAKPGIQSISILILSSLNYNFNNNIERNFNLQQIIDEIYNIESDIYIKDYKELILITQNLFKNTFEKYLTWGLQII